MAKSEQNKAEIYRQERKDRLAVANKTAAKRRVKHPWMAKAIKIGIACVVVLAILVGSGYGIAQYYGLQERFTKVMKVGDMSVTAASFKLSYLNKYNNHMNMAQQYQQYGADYGLDPMTSPRDQKSQQTDESGAAISWADLVRDETINSLNEFLVLYQEATAAGLKTTDEEKEEIDEEIQSIKENAAKNGYGIDAFFKLNYGNGVTVKLYKDTIAMGKIIERYQKQKEEEFKKNYTEADLKAEYEKDKDTHDSVDLRYYLFASETLTAETNESDADLKKRQDAQDKKAKEKADAFLEKVTDEASYIAAAKTAIEEAEKEHDEDEEEHDLADPDKSTKLYGKTKSEIQSNVSEDGAKWVFADGRKALDKGVYKSTSGYVVLLIIKTQYASDTVTVRHILLPFDEENTSSTATPTEAQKTAAKQKADDVLKKYNDGAKTEDSFSELAKDNSKDSNAADGGIYEYVKRYKMVTSFDNWIFTADRKAGDVEIVETEYGYHVIYFVAKTGPEWKNTLLTNHSQDDYSKYLKDSMALDKYKLEKKMIAINTSMYESLKVIDNWIANMKNQQQSSAQQ